MGKFWRDTLLTKQLARKIWRILCQVLTVFIGIGGTNCALFAEFAKIYISHERYNGAGGWDGGRHEMMGGWLEIAITYKQQGYTLSGC